MPARSVADSSCRCPKGQATHFLKTRASFIKKPTTWSNPAAVRRVDRKGVDASGRPQENCIQFMFINKFDAKSVGFELIRGPVHVLHPASCCVSESGLGDRRPDRPFG